MKSILRKKYHLNWPLAIIILLLTSAMTALSSAMLQPGSILWTLGELTGQPLLLLLNWLPCLLSILLLSLILRNVFFGASISSLIINLLSYINMLKIEARNDPLVPADIMLAFEGLTAAGEYDLNLHINKLIVILLFSMVLFIAGIIIKSPRLKWHFRAAGSIAVIGLSILLFSFVYKDKQLYNSFDVPQQYNQASAFNTLGFNYSFLYNVSLNALERPDGYTRSEVEAWIDDSDSTQTGETVQPHVIMVMCEAFSDISEESAFNYSRDEDPLNGFKQVAESDRAISGHIVTTAFGGGTSETEFDFLTGMKNYMLGSTAITGFSTIRRDILSLPRIFSRNNYHTAFMHPGYDWFYNRSNVYNYLGISDQTFVDEFSAADYKGPFVSDEAFLEELKSKFLLHIADEDMPLFYFSVTIQNHQSYLRTKYDFEPPLAPVSVELSEESEELLSVYLEGVRDSSDMLLELTEFLDEQNEPVILVFFGDHRPSLKNAYDELGAEARKTDGPEDTINTFKVPFVIWENDAYAEHVYFPDIEHSLDLPENSHINDNFLGALVYEIIGMTGRDAFFDYLNEMRRELPVFCHSSYCLPDGTFTDTLTPEQQALFDKLDKWAYYKLKHEVVD